MRRKTSESISTARGVVTVVAPSSPGVTGGWSTTVPPARPRVVRTRLAVRRAAMASRRVARETPIRTDSSRSGGSVLPSG